MKTTIHNDQPWAITSHRNSIPDFRDGFYMHIDCASLDAPMYMPRGSTIENPVEAFIFNGKQIYPAERAVVGAIICRD